MPPLHSLPHKTPKSDLRENPEHYYLKTLRILPFDVSIFLPIVNIQRVILVIIVDYFFLKKRLYFTCASV